MLGLCTTVLRCIIMYYTPNKLYYYLRWFIESYGKDYDGGHSEYIEEEKKRAERERRKEELK